VTTSRRFDAVRIPDDSRDEQVAIEEPLEIRCNDRPLTVTMRTPGHDLELALGLAVSEGILREPSALESAIHCPDNENAVELRIAPSKGSEVHIPERSMNAYAGCGICGKTTIDELYVRAPDLHKNATRISADVIGRLPTLLRAAQPLFEQTGAVHAAGLFDTHGHLACAREDVGRHNALDKVIGWAAMNQELPLSDHVLLLSGRCGFELAQKAWVAGIPVVASISGPSSLAIELALRAGLTLACFVRDERMTIFSGAERIVR